MRNKTEFNRSRNGSPGLARRTGGHRQSKPKVGFIVSKFPCIDETFILREMHMLAAAGLDFYIYSMKKPDDKVVHKLAQDLIHRRVFRHYFWSAGVIAANVRLLVKRPAVYLETFAKICYETRRNPLTLLKCMILYPKAVYYGHHMKETDVTHIHAFWATFPCVIAWTAHKLFGLPFSFSAHAHDIYEDDSMLDVKLKDTSFVMTCTDYNRRYLSARQPQKKDVIKLIYHGIDLSGFIEDASRRESASKIFRILSIGTLYKTKGFDTLIEACALLQRQGIPFECKIVGDGPEKSRLEKLIAKLGLGHCVFMLGYLSQKQLHPLRRWADVFILLPRPYLHWGLPNVYIESLSARVAVIATPLNAVGELIEPEETGLIVESDNPQAAASALLRMYRDTGLREKTSAAGQKRAHELFDINRSSEKIIDLFARTIGWKPKHIMSEG